MFEEAFTLPQAKQRSNPPLQTQDYRLTTYQSSSALATMPRPINRHTTRRETDAPPSADSSLALDESPAAAAANRPSRDPLGDTHEEPFGPVQLGSAFDDENVEVDASEGASGMTISKPGEGERVKTLVATTARKETYIAEW